MAESIKTRFLTGGMGVGMNMPVPSSSKASKFSSFATWFRQVGDVHIKAEAKSVYNMDPDIVSFHLPLVTKVKMQQERNYERILAEKKSWFRNTLLNNDVVEWWA